MRHALAQASSRPQSRARRGAKLESIAFPSDDCESVGVVTRKVSPTSESPQAEARSPRLRTARASKPLILDRRSIEGKALAYLDRFDASTSRLRRVLTEFVKRSAKESNVDPLPFLTVVDETLERYQQNGLVDDHRYAFAMARNLVDRGASRQAIAAKLYARGIGSSVIDEVIGELSANHRSELDAARALVRKRKLGNLRSVVAQRENYRRDLAVLARAGFDFDTAKRALALETADEPETF